MNQTKVPAMLKPLLCVAFLLQAQQALAQQSAPSDPAVTNSPITSPTELTDHYVGDLGLGAIRMDQNVLGKKATVSPLPYIYGDYGRFFGRLDTFGVKTLQMGDGYLEFSTRVNFDGHDASNGLQRRNNAIPLGIGTYQETPFGAFFLNGFYDVGSSHGSFFEAIYAIELDAGALAIYPQIGAVRQSASYNNYFYGVTSSESAASGYRAYNGSASTNTILALSAEYSFTPTWVANMTFRRTWLGSGITNSPIVNRHIENLGFVTLSYRFK